MEFTLKELAALTGGRVDGDENITVNSFAKIEEAGPGSLTFLANPKYTRFLYTTKASAAIVNENFTPENHLEISLLRVPDAYSTLAELMTLVQKAYAHPTPIGIEQPSFVAAGVEIPEDCYIGAFSYIGANVKLGANVKIYPQCYIGSNVKIGDNTVIRPGVKVYDGCEIGQNCILHSGVVIGADGFGFAPKDGHFEKIPQMGNVKIEDNVEIGANTTIDRATLGSTVIGEGTKLDNLIQVAHNVTIGSCNVIAAQTGIAGSTKIGNCNMIAGQSGFAGHIKVGDRNQIGAQSGVPGNVGDDERLLGYPAINARAFAKTQVYLKRLDELFKKDK